jgi:hypothetical protein
MNKLCSYLYVFIIAYLFLLPHKGYSQGISTDLKNNITTINSKHEKQQAEKLYLHIDKPYYMPGDTIWYKAYLLDEALLGSDRSGILYVELVSDSGKVFKRQIIKIQNGVAFGDINVKRSFFPGNYTLRAYTNWMRNFGTESFFQRAVCIVPSGDQYWLIGNQFTLDKDKNVNMALHFSDLTPKNLGFRDLQLSLLDGDNTQLKQKALTDPFGKAYFKFTLPQNASGKKYSIIAEDMSKDGDGRKIPIPVQLNLPENIDIQFMPEGGALLAGLPMRVGFKAIDENGKGLAEVQGKVYNKQMQEVATFTGTHKGMGSFLLTPQVGESYTAKVMFNEGATKSFALPTIKDRGIALHIENIAGKDSLELNILATTDISNSSDSYLLIGQARGKIIYGAKVSARRGVKKIAKNAFPTGIAKFFLLDMNNKPITRRMVFIDNNDQLNVSITTNKTNYLSKDSVAVQIAVTDAAGKPVKGDFSLAVTDDNKIKPGDINADNIVTRMLLSSDVKGYIEDAGYYFRKEHKDRFEQLDNLLLTQGWADYEWKPVFGSPEKCHFEPEHEFKVTGRVSNIFNKPVSNAEIKLQSDYPFFTVTTQTDKEGRFQFDDFPNDMEKIDFKLQTIREFNVGVVVDEFVPPECPLPRNSVMPWYVNSDSTMVGYITGKYKSAIVPEVKLKPEDVLTMKASNKLLKEVTIKGRFLRRPPPLRLALDEEDIRTARSGNKTLSLMNLLNLKDKINHMYKLLVVDEVPYIPFKDITSSDSQLDIDHWLQTYSTEDILDIRVEKMFLNTKLGELPGLVISIHTNGHKGAEMADAGGYYYHPLPISYPHQFYSPRYTVKDKATVKDKRSTVYWNNAILTNDKGIATASFFTSDLNGTYTFILEGSDMSGNVGFQRKQIQVGN